MTKDLVTYLGFDGDCEAAFKFYASVLNGEILMMLRYADGPPEMPKTPEIANKIMHVRMQIGDRVLMGGDAPTSCYQKPQGFNVNIMVETPAEADRIYAALGEGGTVTMPIGETFFAERFGMLIDRFGTPWMVICEKQMG